MKWLTLVLGFVIGTNSYLINVPISPGPQRIPQTDWVQRQKLLLPLFYNVCEESTDSTIISNAHDFITTAAVDSYDADVLKRFKDLLAKGMLVKGDIFSEYNAEHYEEFEIIRDMMYSAVNFDSFYRFACWARQNVNCGLYVDAIYSAMLYRMDTFKNMVPPPYEVLPNYFFDKNTVILVSALLSNMVINMDNIRQEGNSYIVDANYTATEFDANSMAYFEEDIGLNTYIFLRKIMDKTCWIPNGANHRFGDYVYNFMKNLVTRYDLERYSNGLPAIKSVNWDADYLTPYDSMLTYSDGNDFGFRSGNTEPISMDNIAIIKSVENSIPAMVSHMIQTGYGKEEILNSLMNVLVTGENCYQTMLFRNFGINTVTMRTPSVLGHFLTLSRDPLFWQINKKIVEMVDQALGILKTYSRNELYFAGVELNNVEFKKPMTSFEEFEIDATDSLGMAGQQSSFQVKITQKRLSHKPFSMKLNITSMATQKGFVKIFLGPKMLPGEIASRTNEFMLLDSFEINMKKGTSAISRSSTEMKMFSEDFMSMKAMRKKIEDAEFGLDTTFDTDNILKMTGFPNRLLLPKGSEDGLPFQLFVFIAPFSKMTVSAMSSVTEFNNAVLSPGYPLDLSVDSDLFDMPNSFVKDIIITHKPISTTNDQPYNKPYGQYNKDESSYQRYLTEKSTGGSKRTTYKKPEPNTYLNTNMNNESNKIFSSDRSTALDYETLQNRMLAKSATKTSMEVDKDMNKLVEKSMKYDKDFGKIDKTVTKDGSGSFTKKSEITLDNDKQLGQPIIKDNNLVIDVSGGKVNKDFSKSIDNTVAGKYFYDIGNGGKTINKSVNKDGLNSFTKTSDITINDDKISKQADRLTKDENTYNMNFVGSSISKDISKSDDNTYASKFVYDFGSIGKTIDKSITKDGTTNFDKNMDITLNDQDMDNPVNKENNIKINFGGGSMSKDFSKSLDNTMASKNINVFGNMGPTIDKSFKKDGIISFGINNDMTKQVDKSISKDGFSMFSNGGISKVINRPGTVLQAKSPFVKKDSVKKDFDDSGVKIQVDDNDGNTFTITGSDADDGSHRIITIDRFTPKNITNEDVDTLPSSNLQLTPPVKRTPTVYDYIINYDKDEKEKVYE